MAEYGNKDLVEALEKIANHKFATTLGASAMAQIAKDALSKKD